MNRTAVMCIKYCFIAQADNWDQAFVHQTPEQILQLFISPTRDP